MTHRDKLQQIFDKCLETPPQAGGLGEAYRQGLAGYPSRYFHDSTAHQAWRAGHRHFMQGALREKKSGEAK
jgi:hypothetical protein